MLENEFIVKMTNRDNGRVGYSIPELGIRRNYAPKETKEVTMRELRSLSYLPGGKVMLENCFILNNKEAVDEILGRIEPEYYYTEDDVKTLLNSGSLAQLKDCLDFAPTGVIDLVKELAVKMEINDLSKREAIFKKTGFNVSKAIDNNRASRQPEEEEQAPTTRRTAPINAAAAEAEATPTRRTEAPQYKVITD